MQEPRYRVINLSFLNEFAGGNPDRLKKYISMFLEHAPQLLQGIKDNHNAKNWDSLRLAAHSLKPQVAYMGMKDIESKLKTIEHVAAEQTELESLPMMIDEVDANCVIAFDELKQVLLS